MQAFGQSAAAPVAVEAFVGRILTILFIELLPSIPNWKENTIKTQILLLPKRRSSLIYRIRDAKIDVPSLGTCFRSVDEFFQEIERAERRSVDLLFSGS